MKWRNRITLIIGLLILVSVAFFMIYFKYGFPWKYDEMNTEMTHYLESRYLDKFELEKIDFDYLHEKSYGTYAKAKSTGVSFYVRRSRNGKFEDGYGYEYWSIFAEELLWTYMPEASLSVEVSFQKPLPKDKDVLDHLEFTCWTFYITMPFALDENNKENELNKLLKTIQQMVNDGICFEYILVGYGTEYVELLKKDLKQIQQKEKLETVDRDVWTH